MNIRTGGLLILLAILIALLAVISLLAGFATRTQETIIPIAEESTSEYVPPAPPLTVSDMVAAQPAHGFQLLVSYTDRGFEPRTATIRSGDTVRFTNNSHEQLWVAAATNSSGALYPSIQNGCGSSALDSCKALNPGEYWEFTFGATGSWSYDNNLDTDRSGTINVR